MKWCPKNILCVDLEFNMHIYYNTMGREHIKYCKFANSVLYALSFFLEVLYLCVLYQFWIIVCLIWITEFLCNHNILYMTVADMYLCITGKIYTGGSDGKIWVFHSGQIQLVAITGKNHSNCGKSFKLIAVLLFILLWSALNCHHLSEIFLSTVKI